MAIKCGWFFSLAYNNSYLKALHVKCKPAKYCEVLVSHIISHYSLVGGMCRDGVRLDDIQRMLSAMKTIFEQISTTFTG